MFSKKIYLKLGLKFALCLCAVLGWWSMLYPEFTFTNDNLKIVDKYGNAVEKFENKELSSEDLYNLLVNVDSEHIRIKSRLFEEIKKIGIQFDLLGKNYE